MSDNAKLTRGSIRGHLVAQTLPMIIGIAAMTSVGLVDAYFIGQLGSAELAAISFIFPISVAIVSLGVGVSVGINSVVARALGAGDDDEAARRGNFGIAFAIALGLMACVLLYFLSEPLFRLMQADETLLPLILIYMKPFAFGLPLILAIQGVNGVLRGQGEAKRTSMIAIAYSVANWILDPLLITGAFGFAGYGVAGAAYATVLGWGVGAAMAFYLLRGTAINFHPRRLKEADWVKSLRAIGRVAGPAAFSNSINPMGLAVLTALIAAEGQAAVAGFGAGGRLQSFAVVPLLALSAAIGGIVGQNWGAKQYDRSRSALVQAGAFCLIYGLSVALVLVAAGDWFAGFFSDDPAVTHEFTRYLAISAWGYAGFGVLIVVNGAFNAIDRSSFALGQSFARVFLIMLPVAWLMRDAWSAEAIYTAELAANLAGGLVAAVLAWYLFSRSKREEAAA
ncbi:MATE family efflux transporter [Altererythrobacter sp. ZODW24]|uniref:MATE family efflux transporter n=1 Tax=Altererythrobacter sp. ZODW24 TaxID=2185142 RepID=UPI000DF7300B|nr:MATE family efflux transporter [Altererythrobacter sp. ZODW24]